MDYNDNFGPPHHCLQPTFHPQINPEIPPPQSYDSSSASQKLVKDKG
jgi:hypothetical protein